jgi:hypothetical protein
MKPIKPPSISVNDLAVVSLYMSGDWSIDATVAKRFKAVCDAAFELEEERRAGNKDKRKGPELRFRFERL